MDTPTAKIIQIMRDCVDLLREKGNLEEALQVASGTVEQCQKALGTNSDTIDAFVSALETRAGLYLEIGNYQEAEEDAKQAIDKLENRADRLGQLGRIFALLGAAYDGQDRPDRVMDSWRKAVDFFERHDPPLLMDVAALSNNLGFTAKALGDLDSAENYFLKSLEILHEEVGEKHAETASVSNNLGAMYLSAGYPEQAREMHMMTLETRRELFGDSHPDTAQSHNNLALALLQTGDKSWARRHFEKALAGFESLGIDYLDDLEAVVSNYCDFLHEEGEGKLADVITGRVKKLAGV